MTQFPMTLALFCLLASSTIAAENFSGEAQNYSTRDFTLNVSNPPGSSHSEDANARGFSRVSAVQPAPMTGNEKWHYYLRTTYGPASFAYTALGTGIQQARGSVPEWGGGMEGYGKRFGSAYGRKVVSRSIRIGMNAMLHEDPRYFASGRSGIWGRTMYAVGQTFVSHKDSGGTRFGYSRFVGDFGAAYVSRQWQPDSYHTVNDYLSSGAASIGIDAAKNVWSEFWPDIRRLFHQ